MINIFPVSFSKYIPKCIQKLLSPRQHHNRRLQHLHHLVFSVRCSWCLRTPSPVPAYLLQLDAVRCAVAVSFVLDPLEHLTNWRIIAVAQNHELLKLLACSKYQLGISQETPKNAHAPSRPNGVPQITNASSPLPLQIEPLSSPPRFITNAYPFKEVVNLSM